MRGFSRATGMSSPDSLSEDEQDSSRAPHDYTEGASALDIDNAISASRASVRPRRDSQVGFSYGSYGDGALEGAGGSGGAVFDGPGYAAIPSSVTRMSHRAMSVERTKDLRRMSSDHEWTGTRSWRMRRRSEDSVGQPSVRALGLARRDSGDSFAVSDGEAEDEGAVTDADVANDEEDIGLTGRRSQKSRRRSPSPVISRSVFDNLAHIFAGRSSTAAAADSPSRRPSISRIPSTSSRLSLSRRSRTGSRRSRASSDYGGGQESEDEQERWGYSSGEEDDNSSDDGLLGRRDAEGDAGGISDADYGSLPPSPTGSLPNMNLDPIFGDTRIDLDNPPELSRPPPPGPPSRQSIFLEDEDATVRFVGFETIHSRQWIWRILCVISFGVLGLLGHWFPRLWLRWVTREKAFKDISDGFIVVEVLHSFS